MSRGMNQVQLMGNLTADAKKIESQKSFGCEFAMACGRRYRAASGEWKEEVAFVRCAYWNSQNVFEYLKQGRQIVVRGHLKSFQLEDEATGKRTTHLEVNVDELFLTDSRAGLGVDQSGERERIAAERAEMEAQLTASQERLMALQGELAERKQALDVRERELEERLDALSAALPVEGAPVERIPRGEYKRSPRSADIGTFPPRKRAPAKRKGGRG